MVLKLVVGLVVLIAAAAGWLGYRSATAVTPPVGLVDGHLRPCPGTPNCVSSEATDAAFAIAPLRFDGDPQAARERLRAALVALGGTIVEERDDFLWATFTSRVFRFVDDVELRFVDGEGLIHVRSASRVGRSDFGVNRQRVEAIRARFEGDG